MEEPKIKEKYKIVAKKYMGECLGNAEQAMIAAGYSPNYARGNASKFMQKDSVCKYIEYLKWTMRDRTEKEIATICDIQEFWTTIMNSGRYETKDRLRASELLAKSQGAFNNDF